MSTDSPQFNLFDLDGAKEAKREGMERAALGADETWKLAMEAAVIATAQKMQRFTTDDVFITFYRDNPTSPTTKDARALGPIMLAAARAGVCRKADDTPWRPTQRRSRHAAPLQVWRSLILEPMLPVEPSTVSLPPTNARYDRRGGKLIHDRCAIDGCPKSPGFSVGCFLRKGQLGMWYCEDHWPGWDRLGKVPMKV
jgi:hypothetical protein